MVGGLWRRPLLSEILVSTGPRWSEIADFEPIIARSVSAVRPSEKRSVNTNRKSPTRFPTSLRWSSYSASKSPKGGSKTQNSRFPSKIALHLTKVCYKVSLCENCQGQCCRAFIGLSIRAIMSGGGRPLLPEILVQKWPRWIEIADFRPTVWKHFAVFSLLVNLCNWKLSWLLPKHIPMSTPILVHVSEYLCEIYHFYQCDHSNFKNYI